MTAYDTRAILAECGAVIESSHFVYASGRHGSTYVNKDAVFLRPDLLSTLCLRLALANARLDAEAVVGPAVGGAILAQLVAGHLISWSKTMRGDVRAAFADKTADGGYAFARGYDAAIAGKRVLLVEDILTTGGSVRKVADAARAAGAHVVGAVALVNRGGVTAETVGVPTLSSLVDLSFPSWDETSCPLCAGGVPVRTDLGKGKDFLARKASSTPS